MWRRQSPCRRRLLQNPPTMSSITDDDEAISLEGDSNPASRPTSSFGVIDLESDNLIHIHCIPSINATLSTRQLPSLGLCYQIWPPASTLILLRPNLPLSSAPRRILELGSGTGLVGIVAASVTDSQGSIPEGQQHPCYV